MAFGSRSPKKRNTKQRKDRKIEDHDRAFRRWTKAEDGQLRRRVDMRMPVEDIATAHKRSIAGIKARATKLGIGPLVAGRNTPAGAERRTKAPTTSITTPEPKGFVRRLFKR